MSDENKIPENNNQDKKPDNKSNKLSKAYNKKNPGKTPEQIAQEQAEKKRQSLAKVIQEAVRKPGSSTKETGKGSYKPNGMVKGEDEKKAYREIQAYDSLCSKFNKTILDYKSWAKEAVSYADDASTIKANLKASNDGYITSMFMDMLSPLRNGVTFESFMQIMFTESVMRHFNKDYNADVSKFAETLRQNTMDLFKSTPAMKRLLKGTDDNLLNISVNSLEKSVAHGISNSELDDVRMTPRQVAAIKTNFAEQCYADMRKVRTSREMEDIYNNYNTAVEHLSTIAHNSGFDMSVVAAEERYIVGLKINKDPAYKNVFSETYDLRAEPDMRSKKVWDGDFVTSDGKSYTTGHSVSLGAFTPRKPYFIYDDKSSSSMDTGERAKFRSLAKLEQDIHARAKCFAMAMAYLDDEDCEFGDGKKRDEIRKSLNCFIDEYKKDTQSWLKDDGINLDMNKHFIDVYNSCLDGYRNKGSMPSSYRELCKQYPNEFDDSAMNDYDAFLAEIKHIENKKIIEDALGEKVPSLREKDFVDLDSETKETNLLKWHAQVIGQVGRVARKLHTYDEGPDYRTRLDRSDVRNGQQIINDSRQKRLESYDVDDAFELLKHTAVNLYQGYSSRGVYQRNGSLCFESETYRNNARKVNELLTNNKTPVRYSDMDMQMDAPKDDSMSMV